MNTELLGVLATYLITVALAIPLGRYRAGVFSGGRSPLAWMEPVEKKVLHFCGIRADQAMNWKQFLKALLTLNMLWFVYASFVLIFQDKLPVKQEGNPGQRSDLAINTPISLLINDNSQHYSGEIRSTYH